MAPMYGRLTNMGLVMVLGIFLHDPSTPSTASTNSTALPLRSLRNIERIEHISTHNVL